MNRPIAVAALCSFLAVSAPAQERQISFDSAGKIMEIPFTSPYARAWRDFAAPFERILAFSADSIITVEIYRQEGGSTVRVRKVIPNEEFDARRRAIDSLVVSVGQLGVPVNNEEMEDLRSDFTYEQTAFAMVHGLNIAALTESGTVFWFVAGGSYFIASSIADHSALTRANVEAAAYGHSTGLIEGYLGGIALFSDYSSFGDASTSAKLVMVSGSVGGITHAALSYSSMNAPDVHPQTQYLRFVAERHAMVWGSGLALIAGGEDVKFRTIAGIGVATALSSYLWSKPVFGLDKRDMAWGDALLVDEFMTPWYLTMAAVGGTANIKGAVATGAYLTGGSVLGYVLGMAANEGRHRGQPTVRRTRLLMYGGSLLGLGVIVGGDVSGDGAWWVLAGTTWLGYLVGSRSGGPDVSSSLDLEVRPEGWLLGELQRPTPMRPFVSPAQIAVLRVRF